MRATADGLNDEVIKLTAEKAALKTELTTRTTAWSQTLAYKLLTRQRRQAGTAKSYELSLSRAAILRHENE